jgi:DNA-directed RNA polymerase subunit E'/Rpb7
MFFLLTMKDTIKIAPRKFDKDVRAMLQDQIHKKYSNKVIPGEGLCLFLHSIKHVDKCNLHVSFGEGFFRVTFVLVVFRGVTYEVMKGIVVAIDKSGVQIELTFFKDIYITQEEMPEGTMYDYKTNVWVWEFDVENELCGYITVGDEVKLMVLNTEYESVDDKTLEHNREINVMDPPPPPIEEGVETKSYPLPSSSPYPSSSTAVVDLKSKDAARTALDARTHKKLIAFEKKSMRIRGSFAGTGFGPLNWWQNANLWHGEVPEPTEVPTNDEEAAPDGDGGEEASTTMDE